MIAQLLRCGVLLGKTFAEPDNVNKLKCREIHSENLALELQHFRKDLRTQRALDLRTAFHSAVQSSSLRIWACVKVAAKAWSLKFAYPKRDKLVDAYTDCLYKIV